MFVCEQARSKTLRIYAYTPIKTGSVSKSNEEFTVARAVELRFSIRRWGAVAIRLEVGGRPFCNIKQLFVISLWHVSFFSCGG